MNQTKLFSRLLCVLLSLLMLICMVPAMTISAEEGTGTGTGAPVEEDIDYSRVEYESAQARLDAMTKYFENDSYILYCDEKLGVVAYQNKATGEALFTNPWDMSLEPSSIDKVRGELMSQIIMKYVDSAGVEKTLTSYTDAALKSQMSVTGIKNGVRVEYAIGETSARILVPKQIEKEAFETKILKPLQENLSARDFMTFKVYFLLKEHGKPGIAQLLPVTEKKGIDVYVLNEITSVKELRKLEKWIRAYCPNYTFAEMDSDYEYVEYSEEAVSPPIFRMALEYTIDANGLSVCLPANGLRYDETSYRVTDLQVLPYMGASYKGIPSRDNANPDNDPNFVSVDYSGYTFLPDGSGTLYDLTTQIITKTRVYGEDFALISGISGLHTEIMRMPVFGQVEVATYSDGRVSKRGFIAIIEEGETLASIAPNHTVNAYSSVIPSFITRQIDTAKSGWSIYASRRYTDDYRLRYILLNDDEKAAAANLSNYYECSWMGMACAYRDYLDATSDGYNRLTEADVKSTHIPLYIETFGCVDTVKKIMSIPVTVSVALTSFEDVEKMYDYLAGEGVSNINFKLTGYANGGLYSDVPYKLKWESSVGGKSDFKDLLAHAKDKGFGVYPDFDFVYTTSGEGGSAVNMKKHAARTIENRYTTKRVYSATQQSLVSYFQMVMSPVTYSHFYEKIAKRYDKYDDAAGISLSTFGSDLNSDYDEEETALREDAKNYVIEALSYFKAKEYDVMLEGGNAFTWSYADHILDVPLDSSRYTNEKSAVPFMGVVLHGYVQFAGSALNMEGNLAYAMLKAMENGASVYFVLSYANTELLKEDVLLSQNYSVRYDIWQKRLVEIYKELNSVLADVQTKLIINHQFLDGTRIPGENELLEDILAEAEKQAAIIEEKIEKERLASLNVEKALNQLREYLRLYNEQYAMMDAHRFAVAGNATVLGSAWSSAKDEMAANSGAISFETKAGLTLLLTMGVAEPMAKIAMIKSNIASVIASAKESYNYLVEADTDPALLLTSKNNLSAAIDVYVSILDLYYGQVQYSIDPAAKEDFINDVTATGATQLDALLTVGTAQSDLSVEAADLNAFLFGDDETVNAKYAGIGAAKLFDAYKAGLNADGIAATGINLQLIANDIAAGLAVKPAPTPEEDQKAPTGDGAVNAADPSIKYSVDNEIILVTYGERGAAYKSILLNFNDYAVQTTVNGVLYNVAAYDYVVIYH